MKNIAPPNPIYSCVLVPPLIMCTRWLVRMESSSSVCPQIQRVCSARLLGKEGQNIGDGPFLISAVLKGQMEGGLRLFACDQLQTVQRVDVLDGTPLKKRRELSKISITGNRTSK